MSNKFSKPPLKTKPPAICRKPPEPSTPPLPEFPEIPLQTAIVHYAPHQTPSNLVAFQCTLQQDPIPHLWHGSADTGDYTAQLELEYHADTGLVDVEFRLIHLGFTLHTYTWTGITPRSLIPFDTGLLQVLPAPFGGWVLVAITQ